MKIGGFSLAIVAGAALALVVTGASQQSTAGATPDFDGDLVFNLKDNCEERSNPLNVQGVQADSDRDGFGNQCDGDFTGPAPVGAGNGLVNAQDFVYFSAAFGHNFSPPDPAYQSRADMNSNGFINAQDFVDFSNSFVKGVPGPSGLRCALLAPGSNNLTQRIPCEALRTHRTKCTGIPPQTSPFGVIKNPLTGDDLRFINAPKVVTSVLNNGPPSDIGYENVLGEPGGHCKT